MHENLPLPLGQSRKRQTVNGRRGGNRQNLSHPPQQPSQNHRRDHSPTGSHGTDGGNKLTAGNVLAEIPGGTSGNSTEHLLIAVEGGQHKNPHSQPAPDNRPGGAQPIEPRQPKIQNDDIRQQPAGEIHGLDPVPGLPDNR